MFNLDKYMMVFFVVLVIVMGYLMMSDRPETVSVGRIGQVVPSFQMTDLSGKKTYDENVLKQDWTILNVWASWCAPCKKEHPVLLSLSRRGYRIVGLNFKDKASDAQAFLKERGNPYAAVLFDEDGKYGFDLGVYGVPETILIDKDGVVRLRFAGMLTEEIFKEKFMLWLQED